MLTLLSASNDLNERLLPMMRIRPMAKKIRRRLYRVDDGQHGATHADVMQTTYAKRDGRHKHDESPNGGGTSLRRWRSRRNR